VKLNPTGSTLLYATYLGGSGSDTGNGIAVDAVGNAYLTGLTTSPNFPIANPAQPALGGPSDAFVTKLDPQGSTLSYSTYLGGSNSDTGNDIAVDDTGNAYLTGRTNSTDDPTTPENEGFPLVNPVQPAFGGGTLDAFVAKIADTSSDLAPTIGHWPSLTARRLARTGQHRLSRIGQPSSRVTRMSTPTTQGGK
jgi:hypothetical protein